jgi:hypothetical protein
MAPSPTVEMSVELFDALCDVIEDMMECHPWHKPFDELQRLRDARRAHTP